MKIKIIRYIEGGPKQGDILEARLIRSQFGLFSKFQILSDGEFLGDFVDWLDAVVVESDNPKEIDDLK